MKIAAKWSNLTESQRNQVRNHYSKPSNGELKDNDLNKKSFSINVSTGNIIFYK